jgi:hypothetical protein
MIAVFIMVPEEYYPPYAPVLAHLACPFFFVVPISPRVLILPSARHYFLSATDLRINHARVAHS